MMGHWLREIIVFLFRWSGLPCLIRQTYARHKATILCYHDPDPATFERHLRFLARRYHFISLSELVDAIHSRSWSGIPPRSLVITIDDGHRGNHRLLDVFRRYGVRPTVYLCSQIVSTGRPFWFRLKGVPIQALKRLPNENRLTVLAERISFSPLAEDPGEPQSLSLAQLAELRPCVEYGSHTRFHPILTTCGDEECAAEIATSKKEIETLLGEPCAHFSYPNGDYTEREVRLAREAGYRSARTVDFGWNDRRTDPYRLKITGASDDATLNRLAGQVVGFPGYFSRLLKGRWRGEHPTIRTEKDHGAR